MAEQQAMFDDRPPDLKQQIAELEREIKERRRVYPRMIERGTLTPARSAYQIRCIEETINFMRRTRVLVELWTSPQVVKIREDDMLELGIDPQALAVASNRRMRHDGVREIWIFEK